MQIAKNRHTITNSHILDLIQECKESVQRIGYHFPSDIRFLECKAKKRAGQASYTKKTIVLSTFIYKESDANIKNVILHEMAHHIAGPGTHHGPVWQGIAKTLNKALGCTITRCYSKATMPVHMEELKTQPVQRKTPETKWLFQCQGCGTILRYRKKTKFVSTYNEILPTGKRRWTCSRCGCGYNLLYSK